LLGTNYLALLNLAIKLLSSLIAAAEASVIKPIVITTAETTNIKPRLPVFGSVTTPAVAPTVVVLTKAPATGFIPYIAISPYIAYIYGLKYSSRCALSKHARRAKPSIQLR
jgi:hypothetical protein